MEKIKMQVEMKRYFCYNTNSNQTVRAVACRSDRALLPNGVIIDIRRFLQAAARFTIYDRIQCQKKGDGRGDY